MTWQTPDNIALLNHLAGQGKSAQFIAFQMGSEATRNSIIGFCRRKGIPLKAKRGGHNKKPETVAVQTQRKNFGWRVKRPPKSHLRPPMPDPTLSDPKFNKPDTIHLIDRKDRQCAFICGDPKAMRVCGDRTVSGYSYCQSHCTLSYLGRWRQDSEKQVTYTE